MLKCLFVLAGLSVQVLRKCDKSTAIFGYLLVELVRLNSNTVQNCFEINCVSGFLNSLILLYKLFNFEYNI